MKKIVSLLLALVCSAWGIKAQDTLELESKSQASAIIYGQLNPALYGYALLDRSFSSSDFIHQQVKGNYNQIHDAYSWMEMYSDLSLSYTDTSLMRPIQGMGAIISDYFFLSDRQDDERIIQPFTLLLHNISVIDSVRYSDGSMTLADNQFVPTINESDLYIKRVIKSASLFEMDSENGFAEGALLYHPDFISTSQDIEIQSISIDVGRGFESFGSGNPMIGYARDGDSITARAAVQYLLADSLIFDTLSFYLVTNRNIRETTMSRATEHWDYQYFYDGIGMDFTVGVKFACDNLSGMSGIKRPIIFVPPYRPAAQFYVTLDNYWDQFGFKSLFLHLSDMGYDVFFLKEHSGHESIELAGVELAGFIKHINNIKFANYPNEAWENVLVGYSAGGQHSRYALMYLEKEHMEHGGPHHHTRLYMPFDSPHNGGNVPLFSQAVYNEYYAESLTALMPWLSLNDQASTDMLFWHYNGSYVSNSGFYKTVYPGAHANRINLVDNFENDFIHTFTQTGDLRSSYPAFTRNVAISTGSYKDTYEDTYGLTSGMLLFKQNIVAPPSGPLIKYFNRKLYSSQYSGSAEQTIFKRKDTYLLGIIPVWQINREYRTSGAWEWDNAQGGYKTEFYKGIGTGATFVLRSTGALMLGNMLYEKEVMFMPLVSALGINPDIWWNNNLYYNLQNEDLMRQSFGSSTQSELFGYPHLAYPSTHFQITPFEAIYADKYTYDHIKMQKSVDDYNLDDTYLVYLRNFICDEVEAESVFLQNKVIGNNHVQTDPNYEYRAWYKARNEIVIGKQVSPKTDIGDYVIEGTGDITVYAGNAVMLEPGFSAQMGSDFLAYIYLSDCDANYKGRSTEITAGSKGRPVADKFRSTEPDNVRSVNDKMRIYPNPTNDLITVELEDFDPEYHQVFLYNSLGAQLQQINISGKRTVIDLSGYENGIYLVSYYNGKTASSVRIIKK